MCLANRLIEPLHVCCVGYSPPGGGHRNFKRQVSYGGGSPSALDLEHANSDDFMHKVIKSAYALH
ncbi:hypothetical protein B0G77_7658 [Paraburkholderia sp. BL10I2N1]|nr:hypothetical protein B0G77_7658 [Paraburkholderia sp. BL10I2N1]